MKIQAAALSGQGWDGIPPELQRQANTPWFTSLLQYDPAVVMKKVNQPILIVQGDLDRQVPAAHADKLATLAKARKKAADVQVAKFPTLNHLLVPAKTGEVDEYAKLETKAVSPEVSAKIAEWLNATLVRAKAEQLRASSSPERASRESVPLESVALVGPQRDQRIDARGAARRKQARGQARRRSSAS